MKILSIIFGFIADPFRKVTSHINSEKITKYISKHNLIVYGITVLITILSALTFYLWLK
ncbi:MAG: hypothetical protein J6Y28_01220 [Acholeplasmatales bacterium]|nr:hypothetical protein [Acholeplasmatales bacterium]